MKEPNWSNCSEEELWKYVATHLKSKGIDSVLLGGAVILSFTDGLIFPYREINLSVKPLSHFNFKIEL